MKTESTNDGVVVAIDKRRRNPEQAAQDLVPVLSEEFTAREYVDRHEKVIRYDCTAEAWYVYDGGRWRRDQTGLAFEWTRRMIRSPSDCSIVCMPRPVFVCITE